MGTLFNYVINAGNDAHNLEPKEACENVSAGIEIIKEKYEKDNKYLEIVYSPVDYSDDKVVWQNENLRNALRFNYRWQFKGRDQAYLQIGDLFFKVFVSKTFKNSMQCFLWGYLIGEGKTQITTLKKSFTVNNFYEAIGIAEEYIYDRIFSHIDTATNNQVACRMKFVNRAN